MKLNESNTPGTGNTKYTLYLTTVIQMSDSPKAFGKDCSFQDLIVL